MLCAWLCNNTGFRETTRCNDSFTHDLVRPQCILLLGSSICQTPRLLLRPFCHQLVQGWCVRVRTIGTTHGRTIRIFCLFAQNLDAEGEMWMLTDCAHHTTTLPPSHATPFCCGVQTGLNCVDNSPGGFRDANDPTIKTEGQCKARCCTMLGCSAYQWVTASAPNHHQCMIGFLSSAAVCLHDSPKERHFEGGSMYPVPQPPDGTVRFFRHDFALEEAIGSHACSLKASMRTTNGIPLGWPLSYRFTL
jgi:hypothetical protein